jgi:hypothetical protein
VWQSEQNVAMINPATFILMVIIGGSPPQQRGEFHSYHHCYEAAQGGMVSFANGVLMIKGEKREDREEKKKG